jgi:prephenate dehydratase
MGRVRGLGGQGKLLAHSKAAVGCERWLVGAHNMSLAAREHTKAVGASTTAESAARAKGRPVTAAAVAGTTAAA